MGDISSNCIQQEHSDCNGIIINVQRENEVVRICSCPCHNNMYQLIKKTSAALRINNDISSFDDKI